MPVLAALGLTLALVGASTRARAQDSVPVVPERNVDVIGGPTFLTLDKQKRLVEIAGDPWRNQQVEPHCAVSSRNPSVIVCGAVDYRLVDLPGGADGVHNDSWNMVAQSGDGGVTWASTLHPGHRLDRTANVLSKYDFAADPIVRAGAAGLFYYAGLVANRQTGSMSPPSAIYVSSWIHLNDREDDPAPVKIVRDGVSEIFKGVEGQFRDRPDLGVGEPKGGTCTFQVDVPRVDEDGNTVVETVPQTIPATPAYVAFTTFTGTGVHTVSKIQFTKSDDCGKTWTAAIRVSEENVINQAPQVVRFPGSPRILLFWRRGAKGKVPDALMVVRSDDEGRTFTKPRVFATLCPFDQPTSATMFRSRTVPSAAADEDRAYVVWADRRSSSGQCTSTVNGVQTLNDARVVIATTQDGEAKTTYGPAYVDPSPGSRGHQIIPTVAASAGRVHVSWLDFRNDASGVFREFIDEKVILDTSNLDRKRHTADMRAAEAPAAPLPSLTFPPSHQISQYISGIPLDENGDFLPSQQLQWNVVNPRNFDKMKVVFNGDYNGTVAESFVPLDPLRSPGAWAVNGAPGSPALSPVFHRFWTDSRNMRLLPDEDYTLPRPYTPPDLGSAIVGENTLPPSSLFDPTQTRPPCNTDLTGTKNLEIYTSRSTHGFYAFAPWNNKTLLGLDEQPGPQALRVVPVQRAFPIVVQNTLPVPESGEAPPPTSFRLTIDGPPPVSGDDGIPEVASFRQFNVNSDGTTSPQTSDLPREETVAIRAGSAIARTVYVTSSDSQAPVRVDVLNESTGETRAVFLNPDPTAPPNLKKPGTDDGTKPDFDIARYEVHDLAISDLKVQDIGLAAGDVPRVADQGPEDGTPGWRNPGWRNPGWRNPGWRNPGWRNPGWRNPGWRNPGWRNPGWRNPGISDDTAGGSRQISAAYTNTGNTTSSYDARVLVSGSSTEYRYQLIVYKLYTTTPDDGCDANLVGNTQVLVNIPDYDPYVAGTSGAVSVASAHAASLARTNGGLDAGATPPTDATFSLQPGETAYVVLVVTSSRDNTFPMDFVPSTVTFEGTQQALDTRDLEALIDGDPVPSPPPVVVAQGLTADLAPPSGVIFDNQSFNETRAVDVQVLSPGGVRVAAMTLRRFNVGSGTGTLGARIYTNAGLLHASANTTVGAGFDQTVTIPVSASLAAGSTYRVGFHLVTNPPGGGSGDHTDPPPTGFGVTPYTDPTGSLQVLSAWQVASDAFPTNPNAGVPFMEVLIAGGLSFSTQPGSAAPGAPITPAPRVLLETPNGEPIAGATVTLSLDSNPTGASLTGGTAVTDGSGIATFSSLRVDRAGGCYTLRATAGWVQAVSGPFNITGFRAGPTVTPRNFAEAVPLRDGRILLAGGENSGGTLASAELFDPTTGAIASTGSLNIPRAAYAAAVLQDGHVLVTGGGGNPYEKTAEIYDPAAGSGTFTLIPALMAAGRAGHTATLLADGKVLVAGGGLGGGILDSADVFDPSTETFTPTSSSLVAARFSHTATALLNSKVLIAGGTGLGGSPIAVAEVYDPATGTFSRTAGDMTKPRSSHRAVLLPSGKVLLVGGWNDVFQPLLSVDLYDPIADTFTEAGNLEYHRSSTSATLLSNERLLVAGGSVLGVGPVATVEVFDPATGVSVISSPMSGPRTMHEAALLPNGEVLVVGGSSAPGVYLGSTEIYSPTDPPSCPATP